MHQLTRRIHLFAGLFLLVFILMYFLSGYVMVHGNWFGTPQARTKTRTEPIQIEPGLSEDEMSVWLQDRFKLQGQRGKPNRRGDGSVQFNYVRPGTTFEATVKPGGREVVITEKEFGFAGVAHGLHRLHGYHGGLVYAGWAFVYDLASAGLIVFALSGVVLWHRTAARKWPGVVCLVVSGGFTAAMVLYLMLRR